MSSSRTFSSNASAIRPRWIRLGNTPIALWSAATRAFGQPFGCGKARDFEADCERRANQRPAQLRGPVTKHPRSAVKVSWFSRERAGRATIEPSPRARDKSAVRSRRHRSTRSLLQRRCCLAGKSHLVCNRQPCRKPLEHLGSIHLLSELSAALR